MEAAHRRPAACAGGGGGGDPHVSRAGLTDPRKPIGVFLMVGTSGTGKTETALTLADLLYGGEQNMTDHQHDGVQGGA